MRQLQVASPKPLQPGVLAPLRAVLRVSDIVDAVAVHFRVRPSLLLSISRNATLVRQRHIGMYLARKLTDKPLAVIARHFRRDHSTTIHGIRKITALLESDRALAEEIELLVRKIKPQASTGDEL